MLVLYIIQKDNISVSSEIQMQTSSKLKIILQEWTEKAVPTFYRREFDMRYLEGNEILTIIGARRTGKTYLCHQIIEELKKKSPAPNILYINFEDERLYPLNGDELSSLLNVYFEMFEVDIHNKIYIFLDEIHNMENWSKWARRISEQYTNIKLIITGSSSKLLSKEIATELRGRNISFTVFPLSFREYLSAKNIPFTFENLLYSKERFQIIKQFNLYRQNGGFPAALASPNVDELLKEYYNVMFYRDIVERHNVDNIKLLEDFLALLFDQTACQYTISKTAKKLEEFGYSLSKNTLANFSKYAEEAYLLFSIKKYSFKIREQLRAPKKLYAIDHGLVSAIRFSFSDDYGRIMENIVYTELRRSHENIDYYLNQHECDFLITSRGKIINAIQVSKSLAASETKNREITGLLDAMNFAKLDSGLIITDEHHETIQTNGKKIEIIPLWYWLLTN